MKRIDFDLRFECMKVNGNYLHMVYTNKVSNSLVVMCGGILISAGAILFYSFEGIDEYNINYGIMGLY